MLPGSRLRRTVSAALFGLAVGGTVAAAQTNRAWVDPPAAMPTPASPREAAPPARSAPSGQAARRAADRSVAEAKPQPQRRGVAERKARKSTAPVAGVRAKAKRDYAARSVPRSRSAAVRRERPAASPRDLRLAGRPLTRQQRQTIQRALAAGMEVIHQRTIEFPDGRRVLVDTPLSAVPGRM
jgi:hypothetical protein